MEGTETMKICISFSGGMEPDMWAADTLHFEMSQDCSDDGLLVGLAKIESKQEPMVNWWIFSGVTLGMAMAALEELCTFENINHISVDLDNYGDFQPLPEDASLLSQFIEGLAGMKNLHSVSMSRFTFVGPMINVLTKLQRLGVLSLDILYSQFDALAEIALKDALIMMPALQEFSAGTCTLCYYSPRGYRMSTRHLFRRKNQDPVKGRIASSKMEDSRYAVVISPHSIDELRVCDRRCDKIYVFNIIPNPTPHTNTHFQHRHQQTEDNLSVILSKITDANAQTAETMILRGSPFLGGQLPDLSRFCSLRTLSIINCGLLFD